MIRAYPREQDPFNAMLAWSAALHVLALAGFMLAPHLTPESPLLLQPDVAWIVPGPAGPGTGGGGGAPSPPKEPETPPAPEPKAPEPRVVRPTKDDRDQLPTPDAKKRRSKKEQPPSSGLTGQDAASASSAQLKSDGVGVPGLGLGGLGGGGGFDGDFEYGYYVQQMLTRINQHWQRVSVRGEATVVIRFTIFKDGQLDNVEVEQSSGLSMLDRAAERAVYLASPLPPLPNSFPRDRVGVHLQFVYSDQY